MSAQGRKTCPGDSAPPCMGPAMQLRTWQKSTAHTKQRQWGPGQTSKWTTTEARRIGNSKEGINPKAMPHIFSARSNVPDSDAQRPPQSMDLQDHGQVENKEKGMKMTQMRQSPTWLREVRQGRTMMHLMPTTDNMGGRMTKERSASSLN